MDTPPASTREHGLALHAPRVSQWLLQVLFVGLTLGMTRTVIPALAESEFGVARDAFGLLAAFLVAFGVVKGAMNFVAGRLSERIGRRRVLLLGWWIALPIPLLVWYAPGWNWIVAAMLLLGINQGLAWSMTQTAALDLTRADERGLTVGLNELAGYLGVALAGLATAYLAELAPVRETLLGFGLAVIALALLLGHRVTETLPWAHGAAGPAGPVPATREIFLKVSWRDRRLAALSQAGLVEKFVDALVWACLPALLFQRGLPLRQIGWIVGTYGVVWGCAQIFTGRLSDRIGRQPPNVWGMWICAGGVALMALAHGLAAWTIAAAVTGAGMALLYPNLSAAVADLAAPAWRGSAIGIYRFWRDLGYAIGGVALGLVTHLGGGLEAAFWFVAIAMAGSGALLWRFGEESHPRVAPRLRTAQPTA